LSEIEVRKFKDLDLKGGAVIDGFPSVGLANTIAANFLIAKLNLDQIAALDSRLFPPLSMVYASKPKFPARIYASDKLKIAVFLAEFKPPTVLDRLIANTMLAWAQQQHCKLIISPVGVPVEEQGSEGGPAVDYFPEVAGVGSTDGAREELKKCGIPQLHTGMVAGASGVLLNEGRWTGFDVISLLIGVRTDIPDAKAGAKIIEAINKLLPQIKLEVKPLYEEAEKIDEHLKVLRRQAKPVEPVAPRGIYA